MQYISFMTYTKIFVAGIIFAILTKMLYTFAQPHLIPRLADELESPVLVLNSTSAADRPSRSTAVHIGDGYILVATHTIASDPNSISLFTESGVLIDVEFLWSAIDYDISLFKAVDELEGVDHYNIACEELSIGDEITAIGHPMHLSYIHTKGHVAGDETQVEDFWKSVLVTDLVIIPGMSGGPVLNDNLEIVGISVGVVVFPMDFSKSFTGLSYIVPSSTICTLLMKE
jgi:S1-C subfamily serine protease